MSFWLVISTIALLFSLGVTYWVHNQHQMAVVVRPTPPPPAPVPLISVIVPARNEERNIQACLESLLAQNYPNLEVIAVDDRSSDRTPLLLAQLAEKDGRLRVVQGNTLPEEWAGKPHALWQGAQAARGDWLCFVDADTFGKPELITSTWSSGDPTASGSLYCAD